MKGTNNKGTHKPKTNQNTTHTLQYSKQNAGHTHCDTANKTQDTHTVTPQTNTGHIHCDTTNTGHIHYDTLWHSKHTGHIHYDTTNTGHITLWYNKQNTGHIHYDTANKHSYNFSPARRWLLLPRLGSGTLRCGTSLTGLWIRSGDRLKIDITHFQKYIICYIYLWDSCHEPQSLDLFTIFMRLR